MKFRPIFVGFLAALIVVFGVFAVAPAMEVQAQDDNLSAAFIYVGPVGDLGWTYSHDQGRQYLEENFDGEVETTYVESVPEVDIETVADDLAATHDIVFGTSFGYMDAMAETSRFHDDTVFMHCSGFTTTQNMGAYMGQSHMYSYVAGVVAGHMTESNIIGYVAAHPLPEMHQDINALALGAQSVNPDVEVRVVYSNAWFDPGTEREAAMGLLDAGADVMAQYQDSPAVQQAAEERGAYSIGFHADMREFAPDSYLTGPAWDWGPYYVEVAEQIQAGTWEPEHIWSMDMVGLTPFSDLVPEDVQEEAGEVLEQIEAGEIHPFEGPIYDRDGNLRVEEGERLPDGVPVEDYEGVDTIWEIDFFVEGVRGGTP